MSDPRDTQHIKCDCVPSYGPPHCHLCSKEQGKEIEWNEENEQRRKTLASLMMLGMGIK